jgi:hypothetical protein
MKKSPSPKGELVEKLCCTGLSSVARRLFYISTKSIVDTRKVKVWPACAKTGRWPEAAKGLREKGNQRRKKPFCAAKPSGFGWQRKTCGVCRCVLRVSFVPFAIPLP